MNTRTLSIQESPLVNQLVSKAFQYVAPHTFFDDFPIWASTEVTRLGTFDGNTLVSHVGIRFAEMKTGSKVEKVALIGAVATLASHRGKGLSTNLLKEAIRLIENEKCTWSFLWGSEHDFYAKLGFQLAGKQARGPVSLLSLPLTGLVDQEIKTGLNEKIFESLCEPKDGLIIAEKDRSWVFAHKTVNWLHVENPFAFVAYGRGMDLRHIVHEWGGDTHGVQKILYQLYGRDPQVEVIGTEKLVQALGFESNEYVSEFLCLARPTIPGTKWNDAFWISGISAC